MRRTVRFGKYPVMAGSTARHRALADPTRVRILDLLRSADGPLTVADLAAPLGLHPNTVRSHLHLLDEAELVVLLRRRGFAPETTENELVMNRCPFRELAERYPRVVCSFHAGLIGGALEELGCGVSLETLEPWVTPTTCVARFG